MVDPTIATIALVSIVSLVALAKAPGNDLQGPQAQTLLTAIIEILKRLGK